MREVIGTPLQIPARSLAAASFFDLVLLSPSAPYPSPSTLRSFHPAVNFPISECNLERILRASCRTYTSPGVLWNRMEGKRDVETGRKE